MDETARRNSDSRAAPASRTAWGRLTRRAEFQRVSKGRRAPMPGFTLQAQRREATAQACGPRVGLTVTKKVGNSVVRNRIRRRLREALRAASPLEAALDHDYVLMARIEALTSPFETLVGDISRALRRIHAARRPAGASPPTETVDHEFR